MDMNEFLQQLAVEEQKRQVASVGDQNLNVNTYTKPTLGANANAYQPTTAGLLGATISKEVSMPVAKDLSLANSGFKGGIVNQGGNTAPYGQYTDNGVLAKIIGGSNPNALVNYMTPIEHGSVSAGANYSKDGLGVNAQYQKLLQDAALKDWMLRIGINANPIEQQIGATLSKSF